MKEFGYIKFFRLFNRTDLSVDFDFSVLEDMVGEIQHFQMKLYCMGFLKKAKESTHDFNLYYMLNQVADNICNASWNKAVSDGKEISEKQRYKNAEIALNDMFKILLKLYP